MNGRNAHIVPTALKGDMDMKLKNKVTQKLIEYETAL